MMLLAQAMVRYGFFGIHGFVGVISRPHHLYRGGGDYLADLFAVAGQGRARSCLGADYPPAHHPARVPAVHSVDIQPFRLGRKGHDAACGEFVLHAVVEFVPR
jgi:hypothetical protein